MKIGMAEAKDEQGQRDVEDEYIGNTQGRIPMMRATGAGPLPLRHPQSHSN